MKNKKRARSSSLFLMELILAILFFSIASAVCVQFFVKSHLLCKDSQTLNYAVNTCSSVAESLSVLPPEEFSFGTQDTYYDQNFSLCKKEEASYVLRVTLIPKESLIDAQISMYKNDNSNPQKEIYTLQTSYHIPRRTTHEAN